MWLYNNFNKGIVVFLAEGTHRRPLKSGGQVEDIKILMWFRISNFGVKRSLDLLLKWLWVHRNYFLRRILTLFQK